MRYQNFNHTYVAICVGTPKCKSFCAPDDKSYQVCLIYRGSKPYQAIGVTWQNSREFFFIIICPALWGVEFRVPWILVITTDCMWTVTEDHLLLTCFSCPAWSRQSKASLPCFVVELPARPVGCFAETFGSWSISRVVVRLWWRERPFPSLITAYFFLCGHRQSQTLLLWLPAARCRSWNFPLRKACDIDR